ncbi:hypothetical protein LCGC14_1953170 [marine sediment metagenome]|uniref:RanBP2-type domain-containing protein n=1 Tax=marine sediment metagenome TaxID=412755 RepID=A0A0F9IDW6_9ZZZZ
MAIVDSWTCSRCNYMNDGPICTHCGKGIYAQELKPLILDEYLQKFRNELRRLIHERQIHQS